MKSMTGFGRSEAAREGISVTLQISSVNRKNLEVLCSLSKEYQHLERGLLEQVRKLVSRGRLQFSWEIRNEESEESGLPSDAQLDVAIKRLKAIAAKNGFEFQLDSKLIVDLSRILDTKSAEIPVELLGELMTEATTVALAQLLEMRVAEGNSLLEDLRTRRQILIDRVKEIQVLAPDMVSKHRENLHARLAQANLDLDVEDERVLKEIALYSDRCDISEELTRLESHFQQFETLLNAEDAVGRRIEFLLQEIGREINTTGSKACTIEVSRKVLEMKNELERIREQVANVE